jgi:hypothetical protein
MKKKCEVSLVDKLRLNAIEDPEELVKVATCHENPEVAKAAIDKLMKLDLVQERKAILACHITKAASQEAVACHAFSYCSSLELPDNTKQRMITKSIGRVKFKSLRKKMKKWLEETK